MARCLAKDPDQRPTVPHLIAELGRASETGHAGGFFTEAGWLPESVAAEIARRQAEPLPEPIEQTAARAVPTTLLATAPVPGPPTAKRPAPDDTPDGELRRLARRRILTGIAVATTLALASTTAILSGGLFGEGGDEDDGQGGGGSDAPTRQERWSYDLNDGAELSAVAEGRVYLVSDENRLYALDADNGDELWTNSYTARLRHGPGGLRRDGLLR